MNALLWVLVGFAFWSLACVFAIFVLATIGGNREYCSCDEDCVRCDE